MPSVKVLIHLPRALKVKLDAKRNEGYTISGYVRKLLEKDLECPKTENSHKGGE